MAVTGMINTVDAMDADSGLLLFTDADAKDFCGTIIGQWKTRLG
jgi:hypothetical protein